MDGSRFDGITRTLATAQTRRRALRGIGGAVAGLLAHFGIAEVAAGCVKPGKKGCKGPQNKNCCQGARCQGGDRRQTGRCVCKGSLKQCGATCVNTKTDKRHCGGCSNRCGVDRTCVQGICDCASGLTPCGTACADLQSNDQHCGICGNACTEGTTCRAGACATELGCRVGDNFCNETPDPLNCPGDPNNPKCRCVTDVHGTPRCSRVGGFCSTCTSNAECPTGYICTDASGGPTPGCGCPFGDPTRGTGNACFEATCNGRT